MKNHGNIAQSRFFQYLIFLSVFYLLIFFWFFFFLVSVCISKYSCLYYVQLIHKCCGRLSFCLSPVAEAYPMVAVAVGVVEQVVLVLFVGRVEDGALAHVSCHSLLQVAIQFASVDPLLQHTIRH